MVILRKTRNKILAAFLIFQKKWLRYANCRAGTGTSHIIRQNLWATFFSLKRSIQPKFQPVRPGKVVHLKRWTRFFETFRVGPNRSIEFWTEISGNFGWMDRALKKVYFEFIFIVVAVSSVLNFFAYSVEINLFQLLPPSLNRVNFLYYEIPPPLSL